MGVNLTKTIRTDKQVPLWQHRCRQRPEVAPDESTELLDGVSADVDAVFETRVGGLEGGLDALSGLVVAPAVVGTAQAALLGDPKDHVDEAVSALAADQSECARAVAIEHEVLAEDAHRLHRVLVELRTRRDRMPVAAHHLAAGSSLADPRETIVLFGGDHDLPPCRDLIVRAGAQHP